jgi:molecular chaperone GrpE
MKHKPDKKEPSRDDGQLEPETGATPPQAQSADEAGEPVSPVQAELNELMERLKRTTADYLNYQKRVTREMAEFRKYANAEFAKEILVVVDDLERAMEVKSDSPSATAILDGVRITHEHLMALLARHGVTAIDAAGQPFDPQLHQAMMQQPSDEAPPMTVLSVLARGYRMHDRVLRPAKVIVSAAPAEKSVE